MTQSLVDGHKLPHKDLVTDMRVVATLRMSLALQEAQEEGKVDSSYSTDEPPIALLLNVDIYSTIRLYQVLNDLTELVFQFNLSELVAKEAGDDFVQDLDIASVDFCIKLKMIFVTTLDNQVFLISPKLEIKKINLSPTEDNAQISESLVFEHQNVIYVCLGFSNGQFLVENLVQMAKNGKLGNEQIVTTKHLKNKISQITYLDQFGLIGIGTRKGEFLLFDFLEREPYCAELFQGENITQMGHLPPEIKDAKKHIMYVLTDKNLYCVVKMRNIVDKFLEQRPEESSADRNNTGGICRSSTQEGLIQHMRRNSTFEIDQRVPMSETSESSGYNYLNLGTNVASSGANLTLKGGETQKTIQRHSAESIEAMRNANIIKSRYYDAKEEDGGETLLFP